MIPRPLRPTPPSILGAITLNADILAVVFVVYLIAIK